MRMRRNRVAREVDGCGGSWDRGKGVCSSMGLMGVMDLFEEEKATNMTSQHSNPSGF